MKKSIALLSTLLFLGAGCFGQTPANTPSPEPTPDPIPTPTDCPDVCAAICAGQPEPDVPPGCGMPMCFCDEPVPAENTSADVDVNLNVSMSTGNFFFSPSTITAEAGQTVNVTISGNDGFHTFVIDAIDFKKTVAAGETFSFTAPSTSGSYEFYCDVGSHRAMGMTGTLVVE